MCYENDKTRDDHAEGMRLRPSEVGWQSFLLATRKDNVSPRKIRAIIQILHHQYPNQKSNFRGFARFCEVLRSSTSTRSGPDGYGEYSHRTTNDEAGLSAPISLDNIRSHSLPLARSDLNTDDDEGGNVVRDPLRTAIKLILDLQKREETAFPGLRRRKNNRSARADRYATKVLRKVNRKGSSRAPRMNFVMEEIEALDREEPSYERDFSLWSPLWN